MTLPHGDQVPEPTSLEEGAEEHIDLSDVRWDDSLVFITFWALAFVVFLQFFTRYVLNDSFAWTEESAINCLVVVVFLGSVMCTRLSLFWLSTTRPSYSTA